MGLFSIFFILEREGLPKKAVDRRAFFSPSRHFPMLGLAARPERAEHPWCVGK
jgi:hypothetical protein